jgi:hypothetical protein
MHSPPIAFIQIREVKMYASASVSRIVLCLTFKWTGWQKGSSVLEYAKLIDEIKVSGSRQ